MRTTRCKYGAPNHKERMKKLSLNVMDHCRTVALLPVLVLLLHGCALRTVRPGAPVPGSAPPAELLARQVEVIRTDYGVPHIYAEDFRALGYALGYLQSEDYGARVARGLVRARKPALLRGRRPPAELRPRRRGAWRHPGRRRPPGPDAGEAPRCPALRPPDRVTRTLLPHHHGGRAAAARGAGVSAMGPGRGPERGRCQRAGAQFGVWERKMTTSTENMTMSKEEIFKL